MFDRDNTAQPAKMETDRVHLRYNTAQPAKMETDRVHLRTAAPFFSHGDGPNESTEVEWRADAY